MKNTMRLSGKKKAHEHQFFGPVGLWDKPRFSLMSHNRSPVCPRDKPSLSLGQPGLDLRQKSLCVKEFMCLFSLAVCFVGRKRTIN